MIDHRQAAGDICGGDGVYLSPRKCHGHNIMWRNQDRTRYQKDTLLSKEIFKNFAMTKLVSANDTGCLEDLRHHLILQHFKICRPHISRFFVPCLLKVDWGT